MQYLLHRAIKYLKDRNIPIISKIKMVCFTQVTRRLKAKNKVMSVPYHAADYVFWQSEFCKTTANKFR